LGIRILQFVLRDSWYSDGVVLIQRLAVEWTASIHHLHVCEKILNEVLHKH